MIGSPMRAFYDTEVYTSSRPERKTDSTPKNLGYKSVNVGF